MEVKAVVGNLQSIEADAIIVNLFENSELSGATRAVDEALGGAIQDLVSAGDFSGKAGQVTVLYPRRVIPAHRVILVGLGDREKFKVETVRRAAASTIQKARDLKVNHVASVTHGAGAGGLNIETAAEAITEASFMALYGYYQQKSKEAPEAFPKTLSLVVLNETDLASAEAGVHSGQAIASGVRIARDLVNMPPNFCTPIHMAEVAKQVAAEVGLKVTILEQAQMEALKMGALLSVSQGSDTPPRFIILEHHADRTQELDTLVLIGKGVTFDTGGYSIKTAEGMENMKNDMAGGAAVIGAMRVIGEMNLPLHVIGIVPSVDNMISGNAFRPSEVITASNGVTIEIISTDAEGRMILADALVFADRFKPTAVVDIATLTGACVTALGGMAAGLFSTSDVLRDALLMAGEATNEKVWPMPLFPEYDKLIESNTADIKNSGGRFGGACTAAAFLNHFVSYPAWAHIDMAGMGMDAKDSSPYLPKGATGYGVRLFVELARRWGQA
ncbi:MAG: putative cytosol aminopeptidase [Chloroflexota bacterium]|nr:leucyl aminopeptidase [Chloroflexota bacterium]NOG64572.1 leucyl aminopeptidase [Chloroflexota bacterium]GIK63429.1 MAG: putative cytosol aminopeptidase [Chloroflexota bacterium]